MIWKTGVTSFGQIRPSSMFLVQMVVNGVVESLQRLFVIVMGNIQSNMVKVASWYGDA